MLEIETKNKSGIPTEMKKNFHLRVLNSTTNPAIVNGDYHGSSLTLKWRKYDESARRTYIECEAPAGYLPFLSNNNPATGTALNNTFELIGEEPKHTVVLTWHTKTPSQTNGYWCGANMGSIVQGIGKTGLYHLVAKPMDGGNMSIPSTRGFSRSGITGKMMTGIDYAGYNRFSIEGLNSCFLQDMPPRTIM